MFWGLIMEPNERYTRVVEKPFHIYQAALDSTTGENTEPCQVKVVVDGKDFLVCTLQKSNCLQVPLNLYFKAGDSVSFLTNGKSNIHLTGYLDPEFEDDLVDEEEDDEEAPALVEPSKKRKLENAADQKSKKAKNKSESLRVQLTERVEEIASLREALSALESRMARLELRGAQPEGDLQRASPDARDRHSQLKNEMLLMVGGWRYLEIGADGISVSNTTVGLVNGSYVVKADYPGEVEGVSVTQGPAGKVVATGGRSGREVSNTTYIYDVAEDRWTSGPSMNTPRWRHSSVTVGTKVYVIGGRNKHNNDQSSVEVWDWSLGESSKWEYVSPMRTDRSSAAAVVYKGDIYVTGGGYGVRSGEKYIVGNDTWVPIPDMIHSRYGHGLVTFGNKMYAIGGAGDGGYLKSVESFDGVQWVEETSLNVERGGAVCGVVGGEVYVVGGNGDDDDLVRSMEVGSNHLVMQTAKNVLFGDSKNLQPWGLIILLLSKSVTTQITSSSIQISKIEEQQRMLAELTEMIRTGHLIHRGIVNVPVQKRSKHMENAVFGNKIAILLGDYLLVTANAMLAGLRNSDVSYIISTALRDLSEGEFFGERDEQNQPLPGKPKREGNDIIDISFDTKSITVDKVLGNPRKQWTARTVFNGVSLLGRGCQSAMVLGKQDRETQNYAYHFGCHLGLAWQAATELQTLTSDSKEQFCLASVPVLFALEGNPELYSIISRAKRDVNHVDYEDLKYNILKTNAVEKTKRLYQDHARKATNYIESIGHNESVDMIKKLINTF